MILGEASAPSGLRLYAIGDIHGCLPQAERMFAAIDDDLRVNPVPAYEIITLGDYVDRGPDSRGVIELLTRERQNRPLTCLLGNHDQRMLEFMDIPEEVGEAFLVYGGRELLASYGVDPDTSDGLIALSREFRRSVPRNHVAFIDELALSASRGDYFFCHAGIKPGIALEHQAPDDLLWIRDEFLIHQRPHPKVIIHGHTPRDMVDVQSNRINVDTCCFQTGVLSCVVLEDREYRFLFAD